MSNDRFSKQYINGEWVPSTNAPNTLTVIDSNTNQPIAQVPDGSAQDAQNAIKAARAAFTAWSETPVATRKELVVKFLDAHKAKKAETVEWITKELGCTKAFAENVQSNFVEFHGRTAVAGIDSIKWYEAAGQCTVVKEAVGVVGCITPWNYPLNQISLKIVPALLCGCTVVLKPSEVTPINAYLVAEAMHEAGLPPGVFNMVVGGGPNCGQILASDPDVDLVSFTGSTRAGKQISEAAVQTLKRVRTELGGKSAAILLDDANFGEVMPSFLGQLVANSGQSCNALSRMLVPRARYEEAVNIAKDFAENTVVGKADDPKSQIGPVVSQLQWDRVQELVNKGIAEGARVVAGGLGKPEGLEDGFFVKPTIFADVTNTMTVAREEIFGPVLSMIPYDTEAEAVAITNDTIYGLNNAVASSDKKRALAVSKQLRSGMVMVNQTYMDPQAPFGGYKQSGNAREWGLAGLEEFILTKTVNVPVEEWEACL